MDKVEMLAKIKEDIGDETFKYVMQNGMVKQELEFVDFEEKENKEVPEYVYHYADEFIRERADIMLTPNRINVGDGVTVNLWSDRYAATVIKKTAKSVTVRRDKATLDPNFKPEWIAGGFAGHCVNQDEQSYTYEPNENGELYTFRWSDKYGHYGQPNDLTLSKGRHEFYDYNF